MKTRDSSPPLHVHVPETTPVHVHLKRSQKSVKPCQVKTREVEIKGDVVSLRTTATAKIKTRAPWIPPGKTSIRESGYKWEGPSHTLEILSGSHGDSSFAPLKLGDLSDQVEEETQSNRKKHGRKIDRLMMDAGSPKEDQAVLLKKLECLRCSANQEELEEAWDRPELEDRETDLLLRKLVEAEIDGVAVANQLAALKETIGNVKKDKRLSKIDAASVAREQELLIKKIEAFDGTNRMLRELLRACHERETESLRMTEQRHTLLKKLADSEAEKLHLLERLENKQKEAIELAVHLDSEKDNAKTTGELSKVLESTRSRLMTQLSCKEAENGRLIAQIKNMEVVREHQQEETQALMDELMELKRESEEIRECQRHETQTLKQRLKNSEDSTRQLNTRLMEKDAQLVEALSTAEDSCARYSKEASTKNQLEAEMSSLKSQVTELTAQLQAVEQKGRTDKEKLLDQLHRLNSDNTNSKLENQSLKASLSAAEERCTQCQSEAYQLKTTIKKHESLMDKYKSKVQKARSESEDHCLKLQTTEKEARDLKLNLEREIEQVRRELLGRLLELEPLPDMLKVSEQQLREAQEQAHAQERTLSEQTCALSELRNTVEQQNCRVETLKEKNLLLQEENRRQKYKMESIERQLEEANLENRNLAQVISKREDTIHSTQRLLEERGRECSILSKQLEQVLEDAQKQVADSHERALSKERTSQSKALDLEQQLGLAKTDLTQLRRNKEDMERRFQSQLKNLKDRLEQSDCTNRSLQNYVQFLKTSYSNVFADSGFTGSLNPQLPI